VDAFIAHSTKVFGARLRIILVNGTKYLTTVADRTPKDNLGGLPEM
jgi:hypothetical protein